MQAAPLPLLVSRCFCFFALLVPRASLVCAAASHPCGVMPCKGIWSRHAAQPPRARGIRHHVRFAGSNRGVAGGRWAAGLAGGGQAHVGIDTLPDPRLSFSWIALSCCVCAGWEPMLRMMQGDRTYHGHYRAYFKVRGGSCVFVFTGAAHGAYPAACPGRQLLRRPVLSFAGLYTCPTTGNLSTQLLDARVLNSLPPPASPPPPPPAAHVRTSARAPASELAAGRQGVAGCAFCTCPRVCTPCPHAAPAL